LSSTETPLPSCRPACENSARPLCVCLTWARDARHGARVMCVQMQARGRVIRVRAASLEATCGLVMCLCLHTCMARLRLTSSAPSCPDLVRERGTPRLTTVSLGPSHSLEQGSGTEGAGCEPSRHTRVQAQTQQVSSSSEGEAF
jgi:hypothetical protein